MPTRVTAAVARVMRLGMVVSGRVTAAVERVTTRPEEEEAEETMSVARSHCSRSQNHTNCSWNSAHHRCRRLSMQNCSCRCT